MKYFLIFLALLWIPAGGIAAQDSEDPENMVFRIGISSATFDTINRNDTLAALKAWGEAVSREQNLKGKIEITVFNSLENLHQAYKNNQVDAFSITVEDSIHLEMEPDFIFMPSREDAFEVNYAILVHRDNTVSDFGKLMDRGLVLYEGGRMVLARFWLKTLLAGYPPEDNRLRFEKIISVDTPSKAILQVFFRQADTAVVTTEAFELACELNPQLKKDITIWAVSPSLISSFFIFREDWQGPSRDRLESAIMNLHTTPGGRQVLIVFQSSRMAKHPGTILDNTRRFIIENMQFSDHALFEKSQP